jgi:short-subunit dehydrogenase
MIMSKVTVITGASQGIGRALAIELASRGLIVIAISRNKHALHDLESTYSQKIKPIVADITTDHGLEVILSILHGRKINFLINNAGVIQPIGLLHQAKKLEIKKLFETNVLAPILLTNALIPYFHDKAGRVLNITSVAANEAVPGVLAYCISKAALNMWTAGLKIELPAHIVAAEVIPGEVDTAIQGELRDSPIEQFPLCVEFQKAKQQHTLIPAATCAEFLADLLLNTTPEEFSSKRWNIYQDFHKPIPQPLNKQKLNSN